MGRIILYILILGSFISCLKKQNLPIEEPQWPRFLFEGWIVYPDTTPVENAKVILVPVVFMFADTMPEESTYTDFRGYFTFGKIPALAADFYVFKGTELLLFKQVVIQRDRSDTFFIGDSLSDSLFRNSVPPQKIYKIPFLKIRNQF